MESRSLNTDYVTKIKGNKPLLEAYVQGVLDGACRASPIYPHPYMLEGYQNCNSSLLPEYYLQRKPFNAEQAREFFDKLRQLAVRGFDDFSYDIDKWVEKNIEIPFFDPGKEYGEFVLKKDVEQTVNPEYLHFLCYAAICFARYGMSFHTVTMRRYFDFARQLGSKEPERLKRCGSGELPPQITHLDSPAVRCFANDAFATVTITIKQDEETAYREALEFLCALLSHGGFPRSYALHCKGVPKRHLPIKGLKKHGINAFFASAARFPALHSLMERYARLAMHEFEWYQNLEAEHCAMPGTFAVFALGLAGEEYFEVVRDYMDMCDDEDSLLQGKFAPALFETFGVTPATLRVFMHCVASMQDHPVVRGLAKTMATEDRLRMLLACKPEMEAIALARANESDDPKELASMFWSMTISAIWGDPRTFPDIINKAGSALRELYTQIME